MTKRILCLMGLSIIASFFYVDAQPKSFKSKSSLLQSASNKKLVETARSHQWSIDFIKRDKDTINIIAIRVEFERDSSTLTTGDGRFGIYNDTKERKFYTDTNYRYDKLQHDHSYFANQLTALKNYYDKVSRGNLTLDFSIYPSKDYLDQKSSGETGYKVPHQMTYYSPGWRRKAETTDEYWYRKTRGLIMFVRDAINAANERVSDSPFRNIYRDDNGILRDATTNRKTVVLIIHAGASYLTDGGLGGSPDSPSDMIDAFIDPIFFKDFKDTLGLDAIGVTVAGDQGRQFAIDEVMMCSETSNQDGLNWGIQGILVNQMARQLGIPDLFSTSSGVSAIGAFCIMDFAGYSSAGQGFIPPYPSAWVRAFMGWDKPYAVSSGVSSYNVKALTSVLDRSNNLINENDTTILLIPLNNNEYYLVENRQRNLSGDMSLFKYDANNNGVIGAYPFNVNIGKNVIDTSFGGSNVILKTKNNDISLPASGILVWHIDERIIRQRLAYNIVNADSSYRGVRLVEADGINDLGVTFVDAFYQAAFDYGGAEDVFPHVATARDGKKSITVRGFGPYTRPSTRSNDGGHTYLNLEFTGRSAPREEKMLIQDNIVVNYSDSVFIVDITYDYIAPGWPRRAAPDDFYDPLIAEISISQSSPNNKDAVMALLSKSGKFYLHSVNGSNPESYGNSKTAVSIVDYYGNVNDSSVTVTFFDSIAGTFTFPTAINNSIYIPSSQLNRHQLHIYGSLDIGDKKQPVNLPVAPSSYVCGIDKNRWALGLTNGRIFIGENGNITDTIILKAAQPVCAVAALKEDAATVTFAAIQNDGTLTVIKDFNAAKSTIVKNGIPPFAIVTGDIDNNGKNEIVISDSRQGVWVYTGELEPAQGWNEIPNDWANNYYANPQAQKQVDRNNYPVNRSAPALVDLNRDGSLDIIIGGTNGIYALNRRGALLSKWPAYLDNGYWYQRGSVTTSSIAIPANDNNPLILFSSPTGERATYTVTKIESASKERGTVTFRRDDGTLDSLWSLSASTIDTILTIGDSLIYPYVLPGGFIDARNKDAARPMSRELGSWAIPQSGWPLSTGAPTATSPLAYRTARNSPPDIFAVANDGMIYRWKLPKVLISDSDSLYWPQTGFDAARSFAYGGAITAESEIIKIKEPIIFWNYPNPTSKDDAHTTFKYQFGGKATNVRLDIYTITGYRMDTFKNDPKLSGDFPDWNEFKLNLKKYGPGIYRCRMEAQINGKKHSKMWKMAVVK